MKKEEEIVREQKKFDNINDWHAKKYHNADKNFNKASKE